MTITDELRNYAHAFSPTANTKLLEITDRIDAAHKAAVDKAHADGERNGLQQARSASEDYRRGFDAGVASGMKEHGYVKLPMDKDGNVITLGSYVRMYPFDGPRKKVKALRWSGFGWKVIMVNGSIQPIYMVKVCKGPTTEDVLCEMLEKAVGYSDAHTTVALNAIAEYAAKLRLKEVDG